MSPGRARARRGNCWLFDTKRRNPARDGLSAGGTWIRNSSSAREGWPSSVDRAACRSVRPSPIASQAPQPTPYPSQSRLVSAICIVARVSITRIPIARVGGVPRARLWVARISVSGISVGWVAVIGARWRWRCSSDPPEYPGCPSDRSSEGGSRPATRRSPNGSARSRSQ